MSKVNLTRPEVRWSDADIATIILAHQWIALAQHNVDLPDLHSVKILRKAWDNAVRSFAIAVEDADSDRSAARSLPSKRRKLQALAHQIDERAINALRIATDAHDKAA